MNWYYAINRERKGPVSETKFHALVDAGTITAGTLVWNQTMDGWTPFGKLNPADGAPEPASAQSSAQQNNAQWPMEQKKCSQCGRSFPEDQLAEFQNNLVCAACKPAFLQRIREGVSMGDMIYAGFWIRLCAKLIDGLILGVISFVINLVFGMTLLPTVTNPEDFQAVMGPMLIVTFVQWAVNFAYVTLFVGKFAATPRKMVCGLKIVTAEGGRVSYLRAFARSIAEMLSGIFLAIGYLMAAFDSEKRTLHDRICSTRVIKKR